MTSRTNKKGSFEKYIRWGGEEEGSHWKANKNKQGEGKVLACMYVLFLKKNAEISKWSLIVIIQFFLLIIMAVWNIKQTIMKDNNIYGR